MRPAIIFLTLGALFANTRASTSERIYVLAAAALLAFLVGLSRIALGLHWAADVLGSWAFGAAWAIAWLLFTWRLGAKAAVRARTPESDV